MGQTFVARPEFLLIRGNSNSQANILTTPLLAMALVFFKEAPIASWLKVRC